MVDRRLLLGLGAAALLSGLVLGGLWLKMPKPSPLPVASRQIEQSVVVAARGVREHALLRLDDLSWKAMAPSGVPVGAYVHGSATIADLTGAVMRRDLKPGDIVVAEDIVRPTEPGFLSAVLGSGMRAVAIAVGPAEGAAGLIVPGDHVDVVLIQNFNDHELELGHRSVGETVLTNLRVIAIDQTVISDRQRSVDPKTGAMVEPRIAKTVTLEVAPLQAEALMVALQLGNIQLTLRNAGDNSGTPSVLGATWSSDVSPALLELTRRAAETAAQGPEGRSHGSAQGPAQSVQILHGSSIELRCFDGSGRPAADCASPAPDNGRPAAAGGSGPAAGTPAAPGASGGRIAPSARQPNL